jgi:hypothetical protein
MNLWQPSILLLATKIGGNDRGTWFGGPQYYTSIALFTFSIYVSVHDNEI